MFRQMGQLLPHELAGGICYHNEQQDTDVLLCSYNLHGKLYQTIKQCLFLREANPELKLSKSLLYFLVHCISQNNITCHKYIL